MKVDSKCMCCGKPIYSMGKNYRGDPYWVHRSDGRTQCQMFATPALPKEGHQ